jgi:hypothetical protein
MEAPMTDADASQAEAVAAIDLKATAPVSLETAELELALQMQDVVGQGFDSAVRHALDTLGGSMLFDMPGSPLPGYQRVAVASTGIGDERRVFLIHLGEDGSSINVEDAENDTTSLAGFAASYLNLMDRLAA